MAISWTRLLPTDVVDDGPTNRAIDQVVQGINNLIDGTEPLTSPTIDDFTGGQHDHEDSAGGGRVSLEALTSGNAAADQTVVTDGSSGFTLGLTVGVIPTGGIIEWTQTSLPAGGWLFCDGAAINRITYADLFAAIGITFGNGNGNTTFNLPDRRGRAGIGMDNMGTSRGAANRVTDANADDIGGSGGSETHVLTASEIAEHTHPVAHSTIGQGGTARHIIIAWTETASAEDSGPNSGGDAHNNMQPWLASPYIIKT